MEEVTVIVLNWNGARVLPRCLEAMAGQTYKEFHLIVVDNGSTDGSWKLVQTHTAQVELIRLPYNMGFSRANNIVLKTVSTPYVALLNNDAFPRPDWLESLMAGLERHPEAGFVASKLLFDDARDVIDRAGDGYSIAGVAYLRGRGAHSSFYDKEEEVFGACAAAALYRKELLQRVGMFDEDFFLLHEDVDLSFRAQLMGYRCVYVPHAVVYHGASSTLVHDSSASVYFGHRNLEWVYLKNMPWSLLVRTFWLHILYNLFACAFFLYIGRGRDFIKAKRDALIHFPLMWKKRKMVQKGRIVDDKYIAGLLEREAFLERVKSRPFVN